MTDFSTLGRSHEQQLEDMQVRMLAARFDGAAHHHAVVCAGLRGTISTRHGAPDRWDWGATLASVERAWDYHRRMQALADSLTPDQRAAVWSSDDPRAKELRRFVR